MKENINTSLSTTLLPASLGRPDSGAKGHTPQEPCTVLVSVTLTNDHRHSTGRCRGIRLINLIMVAMEPRNSVRRGMVLKPYTVPNSSPNSSLFSLIFGRYCLPSPQAFLASSSTPHFLSCLPTNPAGL